MIKTFTICFLLGASCFSSALPTVGQIVPGQVMSVAGIPNINLNPSKISWTPTQTPVGNHLGNGPLSRSQESENEINGGNNEEGNTDEMSAATEDKQLPSQQQPGSGQIPPNGNKRPNQAPQQQAQPTAYSVPMGNQMGNHPPGMPVTQYSGVQMMGYQKELTGQQPVSHQQQMVYSGGSNSIPMIIYSDSERPPITMFLLGNDKQLQGALRTGDFIPNLQPMSQMPMMYSQNIAPFNMPMSFVDTPPSPLNAWDRQLSMFETYSSPQYYPSSNILIKSKENMGNRNTLEKFMKPKSAETSGMGFENEQFGEGRSVALPSVMTDMMNMKTINMNPRAMETPWMIPQRPRLEKLSNMRSMMDWGLLEPKQSMAFEINEPMERSSSDNSESRYTFMMPKSSNTYGSSSKYGSGQSSSYLTPGSSSQYGQRPSSLHGQGSSTYLTPGSSYSRPGQSYQSGSSGHGSSYLTPGSSTKYGSGQSSSYLTPGSSSQYGQGSSSLHGQGSSTYLTPGSSYSRPGQSYQSGSSYKSMGILGASQQQMPMNQLQHMASPYNSVQESSSELDHRTPIIVIVPVRPGDHDQTGSMGHIQHQNIPGGPHQQVSGNPSGPVPASKPRNAGNAPIVGTSLGLPQYGLGVGGLGTTGIIGGGYGNTGLNNQYSNLHNGHLGGQSSGASNNQQYGHENVNTGFVQPLPSGGVITTQVNSDKGFSGNNFGQGSQSLGINDQNYNAGGFNSNHGYSNGVGVGLGGGILPGTGIGMGVGGLGGLNTGIGVGGVGGMYG
ncbi:hypothetical protein WDU94_011113 [Cyamophila willieti]